MVSCGKLTVRFILKFNVDFLMFESFKSDHEMGPIGYVPLSPLVSSDRTRQGVQKQNERAKIQGPLVEMSAMVRVLCYGYVVFNEGFLMKAA
jgi:hypothetical protein